MFKQILKITNVLIALSLIAEVECQTTGTVAGIGIGTFIIILAILFSIIWCLACRTSSRPEIYSVAGVLIPVILIILFISIPKQKDRVYTTQKTDMNFVTHVVFMVLAILAFVVAAIFLLLDYVFTEKKAKNIARSAFIMKEEQQQLLTRRSRLMINSRQGSQSGLRHGSSHSGI